MRNEDASPEKLLAHFSQVYWGRVSIETAKLQSKKEWSLDCLTDSSDAELKETLTVEEQTHRYSFSGSSEVWLLADYHISDSWARWL